MKESASHLLCVTSSIYELSKVQKWFQQFRDLPHRVWDQLNLVLAEGFSNVIYHAHEHLPEDTPVELELQIFSDRVELRIWDRGQSFDLFAKKDNLEQRQLEIYEVEDIPTGGRGLMIMQSIADEISYDRTPEGKNCLFVRKYFPIDRSTVAGGKP